MRVTHLVSSSFKTGCWEKFRHKFVRQGPSFPIKTNLRYLKFKSVEDFYYIVFSEAFQVGARAGKLKPQNLKAETLLIGITWAFGWSLGMKHFEILAKWKCFVASDCGSDRISSTKFRKLESYKTKTSLYKFPSEPSAELHDNVNQ